MGHACHFRLRPSPAIGRMSSTSRGVDLLMTWNGDRPGKPRAQRLTKLGADAIAGIGENCSEANAGGDQPIQLAQRDL